MEVAILAALDEVPQGLRPSSQNQLNAGLKARTIRTAASVEFFSDLFRHGTIHSVVRFTLICVCLGVTCDSA